MTEYQVIERPDGFYVALLTGEIVAGPYRDFYSATEKAIAKERDT